MNQVPGKPLIQSSQWFWCLLTGNGLMKMIVLNIDTDLEITSPALFAMMV